VLRLLAKPHRLLRGLAALPFQAIEQVDEPRNHEPPMDANVRESEEDIGVSDNVIYTFQTQLFAFIRVYSRMTIGLLYLTLGANACRNILLMS
jgi:hypothetical protein